MIIQFTMRIWEFLEKNFYHCGTAAIVRMLLMMQKVVDKFLQNFLRGGMSHKQQIILSGFGNF